MNKRSENSLRERPGWIRGKVSCSSENARVKTILEELNLTNVCVEAACPNRGRCWEEGHVTFMILGKNCTRNCRFCDVGGGFPSKPDPSEPRNIAMAVQELGMKYVVVTSVTRDDLADKGGDQFVSTVREIKARTPEVLVELLIPEIVSVPVLKRIASSGAEVIGHNVEMPEILYPAIRPMADYRKSIQVLSLIKRLSPDIAVKSSIIIGLGERQSEIRRAMEDLKKAGVDILYIGQYLSPSKDRWPVKRYYTLEEFRIFEKEAENMGFSVVCSGPMVRSSYRAYEAYRAYKK